MTKDDKLTHAAAKAAGYTLRENGTDANGNIWWWCDEVGDNWYPLVSDSDAMGLAIKLCFWIQISANSVLISKAYGAKPGITPVFITFDTHDIKSPNEAVRLAIVKAAASLGELK